MGSQKPMNRQMTFLIVSTASFFFFLLLPCFFIAANIVIIIVLSAILVEVHQHCNDCNPGHTTKLFSYDA